MYGRWYSRWATSGVSPQMTDFNAWIARLRKSGLEAYFGYDEKIYVEVLESDFKSIISTLEKYREALVKIESNKNMTRFADCCVEKSCHKNEESNSCSFQTGVHYGNADQAGIAEEALAHEPWNGKKEAGLL